MNQKNQQLNIDVSKLQDVTCSVCENKYFQQAFLIKKVSALLSPTGQEGYINVPSMICTKCGTDLNNMVGE